MLKPVLTKSSVAFFVAWETWSSVAAWPLTMVFGSQVVLLKPFTVPVLPFTVTGFEPPTVMLSPVTVVVLPAAFVMVEPVAP